MTGKKVVGTQLWGKYFWLVMSSPPHPVMHLGMTGWVDIKKDPLSHYRSIQEDDNEFVFVDARRLGRIRLVNVDAKDIRTTEPIASNGPDPVQEKIEETWLFSILSKKRLPVKAFLLDQANLSGPANIESIYTGIIRKKFVAPRRPAVAPEARENDGGPLGDLLEMQCVWFLTEDAESYARQKNFGLALKRYHSVWKVFDDWTEDQFDFHSFSLRKGQMWAYIDMIRWENTLRAHPFFARAVLGVIKLYTQLSDKPHLAHGSLANGGVGSVNFDNMSTADRKKALKKAKQEAQRRQEKEAAEQAPKKDEKKAVGDEEVKKEDDDPKGGKLAQTTEPLADAIKFFDLRCSSEEKYLLALKCLLAAAKLAPENPTLHAQIISFKKDIDSPVEPLPAEVTAVIDTEFYPMLLSSKTVDLVAYNSEYLTKHKDTPSKLFGGLRAKNIIKPDTTLEIEASVLESIKSGLETYTLEDAYQGLELLRDSKESNSAVEEFKSVAKDGWRM